MVRVTQHGICRQSILSVRKENGSGRSSPGCTNAVIDFRGLGEDGKWLKKSLAARPLGHQYMKSDWTEVFDGIVFTKTMFGSERRAR